jgi:hypothetical protein
MLLRAMLPPRLQGTLQDLHDRALAEADSLEALTTVDGTLDEVLAAHVEVAELLPRLRECPDEVPDPPKPEVAPPWVFEEQIQLEFRAAFTSRLAEISPEAWLVRWDDTTYLSRLSVAGAPVVLSSRVDVLQGRVVGFHSALWTSVPQSVPSLDVRREGLLDGIGRALGVVRDARTKDNPFDEAFVVAGSAAAVSLLSPDVERALLAIQDLSPRLAVRRGIAGLSWKGGSERGGDLMPDEVFAIVLGVRATIERA